MHNILQKKILNSDTTLLVVEAGETALAARAGQFVMLIVDEEGERFPITLYDWDADKGTITIVVQAVGVSTKKICSLEEGDSIAHIVGPLGHAISGDRAGKVICIGGGVGTAEAYPVARAMSERGDDVTVIIGARKKELVICEDDMKKISNDVHIVTDDGTYGEKGLVTDVLERLIAAESYDLVFAIGPIPMMKAVADLTRPKGIPTRVSLNSIMVDGTGMCGSCRIQYGGESKFACVDGPEFDAHLVDFEDMMKRGDRYKDKEKEALDHYCKLGLDKGKR